MEEEKGDSQIQYQEWKGMVIVDLSLSFQYEHFYGELRRIKKAVDVVREIRNDHCVKLEN